MAPQALAAVVVAVLTQMALLFLCILRRVAVVLVFWGKAVMAQAVLERHHPQAEAEAGLVVALAGCV